MPLAPLIMIAMVLLPTMGLAIILARKAAPGRFKLTAKLPFFSLDVEFHGEGAPPKLPPSSGQPPEVPPPA